VETKYRLYAAPAREVSADTTGAIQQRARRRPVYTVAALLFAEELPSPLSCTVRDVSETGARLELDRFSLKGGGAETPIPKFVTVYFCPEKTEVECRLAWQDGRHFGVRFLTDIRPSTRQLP
jgi:hypothetical protein